MKFVDRSGPPTQETSRALARLSNVDAAGQTELDRARTYYAQIPTPTSAYDFSVYGEFEVCDALDRLFNDKCAYCEGPYLATAARNVEHYRPKGGVTEYPVHPGYWWLAASWENLLASCAPCNQNRYQTEYQIGMSLEELDRSRSRKPTAKLGKGNHFPMRAPSTWVSTEAGNLSTEDPLLINPSVHDPSNHMEWVFEWDRAQDYIWGDQDVVAALRPRRHNGVEDPYGAATIGIFGLNRIELVRARIKRTKDLQFAARMLVKGLSDQSSADALVRASGRERVDQANRRLSDMASNEAFASMGAAFVLEINRELDRQRTAPI